MKCFCCNSIRYSGSEYKKRSIQVIPFGTSCLLGVEITRGGGGGGGGGGRGGGGGGGKKGIRGVQNMVSR